MEYIIYCRKSTEDKGRQILSLDSQADEMNKIAKNLGLNIVKIFQESKSAKKPNNRPMFLQALAMIKSGKAQGVLCWKIDRLSRNPIDSGQLQWLLQEEKLKVIQTYDRQYLPGDNAVIFSVETSVANQYIRDLSSNVKRGNKAKLERGGFFNCLLFGYINDKINKTIIIDEERKKYIIQAFELRTSSILSLGDIVDILYDDGLRSRTGKKIYKSTFEKIYKNPFYYGVMRSHNKLYPGNHEPTISKDLFDRVQKSNKIKSRPRPSKRFFPYRGFMTCEVCGCKITADEQKGHDYYYCTNGKGHCDQHKPYIKNEVIQNIIFDLLGNLQYDEKIFDLAYKAYREKFETKNSYQESVTKTLTNQLERLKVKKNKLLDTYTEDYIEKDLFEAKMQGIKNEEVALNIQLKNNPKDDNGESTFEQVKEVFLSAKLAQNDFLKTEDIEKPNLLDILLSNFTIKDQKIANFTFKPPYSHIAKTTQKGDFVTMLGDEGSNPD